MHLNKISKCKITLITDFLTNLQLKFVLINVWKHQQYSSNSIHPKKLAFREHKDTRERKREIKE